MNATTHDERLETKRSIGRSFFEAQDRLRGGPAPELCTPDYSARLGSNPPMDRAGHEGFARAFYAAVPDAHHAFENVIVEGDMVVVRFVIHGTHTAPFFGIPASGRTVAVAGHAILRLQAQKVREVVGVFDEAGMLRQIGALPGS
jgi:predicted ester cyclase